jgi:glycosyltransferase involved in cell wall biosynthesis
MSFGLPVLLSDIPPHREVSMDKGDYFKAEDAVELSNKMLKMSFERRGYDEDVRKLFSEENTAARYVEMINSFCTDAGKRC